jgi:hypothetical protein
MSSNQIAGENARGKMVWWKLMITHYAKHA